MHTFARCTPSPVATNSLVLRTPPAIRATHTHTSRSLEHPTLTTTFRCTPLIHTLDSACTPSIHSSLFTCTFTALWCVFDSQLHVVHTPDSQLKPQSYLPFTGAPAIHTTHSHHTTHSIPQVSFHRCHFTGAISQVPFHRCHFTGVIHTPIHRCQNARRLARVLPSHWKVDQLLLGAGAGLGGSAAVGGTAGAKPWLNLTRELAITAGCVELRELAVEPRLEVDIE